MEIINSDEIDWPELFLDNEFIVVNYQPSVDCLGCAEMNALFEKLSHDPEYGQVKFLWVDSRNNPIAEQFIKKRQTPFIAVFKEGFLVECDNISEEKKPYAIEFYSGERNSVPLQSTIRNLFDPHYWWQWHSQKSGSRKIKKSDQQYYHLCWLLDLNEHTGPWFSLQTAFFDRLNSV
jgi:hypothetical protein